MTDVLLNVEGGGGEAVPTLVQGTKGLVPGINVIS